MLDGWPAATTASLDEVLAECGFTVVRNFGERRDSRAVVLGIESPGLGRFVVKHAERPEAIAWLESARRFHADVQHAAIPTVVHHITTVTGVGLVEEWGEGEILTDGYDEAVLPPEHSESTYQRFLRLPVPEVVDAIDQVIAAHVAVADAGYAAVDLYDGCVLYDFSTQTVRLIDLDHYRRAPYILDVDRQIGSSSYMAPEEFRRGSTIDERTMVHTLGRMALVYLGCARKGAPRPEHFRGTNGQFGVASSACSPDPHLRQRTVEEFAAAWREQRDRSSRRSTPA